MVVLFLSYIGARGVLRKSFAHNIWISVTSYIFKCCALTTYVVRCAHANVRQNEEKLFLENEYIQEFGFISKMCYSLQLHNFAGLQSLDFFFLNRQRSSWAFADSSFIFEVMPITYSVLC